MEFETCARIPLGCRAKTTRLTNRVVDLRTLVSHSIFRIRTSAGKWEGVQAVWEHPSMSVRLVT